MAEAPSPGFPTHLELLSTLIRQSSEWRWELGYWTAEWIRGDLTTPSLNHPGQDWLGREEHDKFRHCELPALQAYVQQVEAWREKQVVAWREKKEDPVPLLGPSQEALDAHLAYFYALALKESCAVGLQSLGDGELREPALEALGALSEHFKKSDERFQEAKHIFRVWGGNHHQQ